MFSLNPDPSQTSSEFFSIREDIILFGKLFSTMQYFSSQNNQIKTVPLRYGEKDLWITQLSNNFTDSDKIQYAIDLPAATYICRPPIYDNSRQPQRLDIVSTDGEKSSLNILPVIVQFQLTIASKKSNIIFSLVENIMTKFNPNLNLRFERELYTEKLDITLNDVSWNNELGQGLDEVKIHVATLEFSMKTNLHNLSKNINKINTINVDFVNQDLFMEVIESGCTLTFGDNLRIFRANLGIDTNVEIS